MKFAIFYHKDEGIRGSGQVAPQVEYVFEDLLNPVIEHITKIALQFEASGVRVEQCADCCLYTKEEKPIDKDGNLALQLAAIETKELHLSLHPSFRSKRFIRLLKDKQKIKETVFYLKTKLENTHFAAEFISSGGIPVLVDTATYSSGNTQSYTLSALHAALFHLQGIKVFLETTDLIQKLYCLLDSPIVIVCRQILELLVLICTFDEKGAQKIKEVAKEESLPDCPSFSSLIHLLESGDMDTKINALTLVNSLLAAAAGEELENEIEYFNTTLDLHNILIKLQDIENEDFRIQLRLHETVMKISVGKDGDGAEDRKKKQKEFVQPLFPLMKKEFLRAQRKMGDHVRKAESLPASVQTPLHRYAQQLLQLDPNLSYAFTDQSQEQEKIVELEKQILHLQSKAKAKSKKSKTAKSPRSMDKEDRTLHVDGKKRKKKSGSFSKDSGSSHDDTCSPDQKEEEGWECKKAIYEEKLKEKSEELNVIRVQYQEASLNVKKLAQVVKVMKIKYDALKMSNAGGTDSTRNLPTPNTPKETSIPMNRISYKGTNYDWPFHIDVEEITITHTYPAALEELKKENEALRLKITENKSP